MIIPNGARAQAKGVTPYLALAAIFNSNGHLCSLDLLEPTGLR